MLPLKITVRCVQNYSRIRIAEPIRKLPGRELKFQRLAQGYGFILLGW